MYRLLRLLLVLIPFILTLPGWGQAAQTIHMYPVATQTMGNVPFQVIALASSGLPVSVTVSGPATVSRRLVTLTGPGTVTIFASQAGNGSFAAASAQESFTVNPAPTTVNWTTPASVVYGTPISSGILSASASAVPLVNAAADVTTVTSQLDTSLLTTGSGVNIPATSPVFRYGGSTVAASTAPNDGGGLVANGSSDPIENDLRTSFTCDCQQFEWVMQSRQSAYRLWVDGQWTTASEIFPDDHYPEKAFYRVQFPDKRPRQIMLLFVGNPPFFGVNVVGNDTVSAAQVPLGPRVIIMGDSWTGPTFSPPLLPPAQDGLDGSGFAQLVGEFFNWDWWQTSSGGEGFTDEGTAQRVYSVRAQTDICGRAPAMAMVFGGTNDGDHTAAQEEQAGLDLVNNLSACLPGVPVYIFGPQAINPVVSQGLAAAVPLFPSTVFYDDMSPDATGLTDANWIYGAYDDATTGNAYDFIGTTKGSEGHPTPLGYDYVAEKIEDALLTKYPAMTPTPYTLFAPAPVAGTFTYSAQPGTVLPAGQQMLSASFTPGDTVDYAPATGQVSLTVSKASSTVQATLQTSSTESQIVAKVLPQIGGIPTGTVSFTRGATTLGSAPLSNATATLTLGNTTVPQGVITAQYVGDANFEASNATVLGSMPDFGAQLQQTALTVQSGQTGTATLQVTPIDGLQGGLTVSCSGLPANASCSSGSVSLNGSGSVSVPVTISTVAASPVTQALMPGTAGGTAGGVAALCALVMLPFGWRGKRRLMLCLSSCCLAVACLLAGCATSPLSTATNPRAAAGTYAVTLTLSTNASPAIVHTQVLQLTID